MDIEDRIDIAVRNVFEKAIQIDNADDK